MTDQSNHPVDAGVGHYHPSIGGVLRFFRFRHLPPELQLVSEPFADLAVATADRALKGADGPETTVALRKLLEAKDAAVRAFLADQVGKPRI